VETLIVKDLMVVKHDYATIAREASLLEAVLALENAQLREIQHDPIRQRDRGLLVTDENGRIVGRLVMLDILKGLEPRYERVEGTRISAMGASRVGSARGFLEATTKDIGLWKKPLHNLAEKASRVKVKHFVHGPAQTEIIDEQASLDAALHQLITGQHQSLLVTRNDEIVGILRLTDVYERISEMIKSCGVETAGLSEAQ